VFSISLNSKSTKLHEIGLAIKKSKQCVSHASYFFSKIPYARIIESKPYIGFYNTNNVKIEGHSRTTLFLSSACKYTVRQLQSEHLSDNRILTKLMFVQCF